MTRASIGAAFAASAVAVGVTLALSTVPGGVAFPVALSAALFGGVVTGPLAQRSGPRRWVGAAAVLLPGGLAVLAVVETQPVVESQPLMWLAAGLGVGGGASCVLVPVLTAIGTGTRRHRAVALGVASAGGPVGGAIVPLVAVWLVERDGLRGGLLAVAVGSAVLLAICAAASPARPTAATVGPRPGPMPGFGRLYLGSVALSVAVFVPLAHLPGYAQAHGLGLPFAAAMLSTSSLAGIAGRLLSGPVADRFGAESGMRACALGLAAASGWWVAAGPSPAAVVVFAVLFGLANGGYVGLFPELLISRFGAAGLGARLGLLHTASAVAALVGPLSAGALTAWTGDPTAAIVLTTGAALTGWTILRTGAGSVAAPGGVR